MAVRQLNWRVIQNIWPQSLENGDEISVNERDFGTNELSLTTRNLYIDGYNSSLYRRRSSVILTVRKLLDSRTDFLRIDDDV